MTPRVAVVPDIQVSAIGDGWAAFSPVSGETVLLNTEAAALLETLVDTKGHVAEAVERLARDCELSVDVLQSRLSGAWQQFIDNGLIRLIDPRADAG